MPRHSIAPPTREPYTLPDDAKAAIRRIVDALQDDLDDLIVETFPMDEDALDTDDGEMHRDMATGAVYNFFRAVFDGKDV